VNDTERAFTLAVLEQSADDALRLVFADYLDERDDPRGEFIRVQIELANTAEDDPQRVDLRRRERPLLVRNLAAWTAGIPGTPHLSLGDGGQLVVGRGPFVAEFRRGFVEAVACDAPSWAGHGAAILAAFPVCELRLAPWNVALHRKEMSAAEWAEHTDRAARVIEGSAGLIGAIAPAVNVLVDAFRAFGGLAGGRY
jgi:uncharacterized protein (TIGR02996 family)